MVSGMLITRINDNQIKACAFNDLWAKWSLKWSLGKACGKQTYSMLFYWRHILSQREWQNKNYSFCALPKLQTSATCYVAPVCSSSSRNAALVLLLLLYLWKDLSPAISTVYMSQDLWAKILLCFESIPVRSPQCEHPTSMYNVWPNVWNFYKSCTHWIRCAQLYFATLVLLY